MRGVILLLALCAASCRVPGKHVRTGPELPARERFCDLRTYPAGEHPAKATVVGTVEAEAHDRETLLARLQSHACFLGADALVQLEVNPYTVMKEQRAEDGEWRVMPAGQAFRGRAIAVLLADPTPVKEAPPAPPPPPRVTPPPPPPPAEPDAGFDMGDDLVRERPDAGPVDAGTPDAGPSRAVDAGTPDAGAVDEFALPPLDPQ